MKWDETAWTIVAYVLLVLLGVLLRRVKRFSLTDISPYNRFIFTVGMGCLAFTNITSKPFAALNWRFVLGFGAVRAFGALCALIFTLITKGTIGDFAVHLLAASWMDVNTFAGPFLGALYGPTLKALAPQAAFTSFVFALPIALIALEIHQWRVSKRKEPRKAGDTSGSVAVEEQQLLQEADTVVQPPQSAAILVARDQVEEIEAQIVAVAGPDTDDIMPVEMQGSGGGSAAGASHASARKMKKFSRNALRVAMHFFRMSPLVGILLGIIWRAAAGLSVKPLPTVINTLVTLFGACVPPLAAFNVGLFVADGAPFKRVWKRTLAYLSVKLLLLPVCALGIIRAVGLVSPIAESAIIFSAMPLAFPAFAIVRQYVGIPKADEIMSTCICCGVILVLPVLAIWWAFLTNVNIFPVLASSS